MSVIAMSDVATVASFTISMSAPKKAPHYSSWLNHSDPEGPNSRWPTDTKWMTEYKRCCKFLIISRIPMNMALWQYYYFMSTLTQFPLAEPTKDNGVVNTCHMTYAGQDKQLVLVEYGNWEEAREAEKRIPQILCFIFADVKVWRLAQCNRAQQEGIMERWEAQELSGRAETTRGMWRKWQQREVARVRTMLTVENGQSEDENAEGEPDQTESDHEGSEEEFDQGGIGFEQ